VWLISLGVVLGVVLMLGAQALLAPPIFAQAVVQKRIPGGAVAAGDASAPAELSGALVYEFLVAEIALQRGQPQLAAQAWLDLAKKTRDARVARRATEVAWRARMPQVALDAARIWNDLEPESNEAAVWRLQILVATNRLAEAQPGLEAMLARASGDRPFLQLARLLSEVKDRAAGLKMMRELARPYPQHAAAHLAIAQVAVAADQADLAITEARAASNLRPDWELPVLLEAQVLARRQDPAANERLRLFIESHPKAGDVRLAYARALASAGKAREAREQFARLALAYPDNADVIFPLAVLSIQSGELADAERHLRHLLEIDYADPDRIHLYLGEVFEQQKRFDEAIESYREVGAGEHRTNARVRIAMVMNKAGRLEDARRYLHELVPEGADERNRLVLAEVQLLREVNRFADAFTVISEALGRTPDQPDLLYEQGMLAERLDRLEVMEKSLRAVMALRPDQAQAYNALGYSLADRGKRLTEARALIERAVKLAPDDFFILDSLGWVQFRQGELKAALASLQRAYAGQADGEIAAHLGEVLWALGRQAEAEAIWAEAFRRTPDNETLQKTRRRFLGAKADAR
jgi:Flp pilus assembly protein TadD